MLASLDEYTVIKIGENKVSPRRRPPARKEGKDNYSFQGSFAVRRGATAVQPQLPCDQRWGAAVSDALDSRYYLGHGKLNTLDTCVAEVGHDVFPLTDLWEAGTQTDRRTSEIHVELISIHVFICIYLFIDI